MLKSPIRHLLIYLITALLLINIVSCGNTPIDKGGTSMLKKITSGIENDKPDKYVPVYNLLVLPRNPAPGENFRIMATGGRNIKDATIVIAGSSAKIEFTNTKTGDELPYWRIDDFKGTSAGNYSATLIVDDKEVCKQEFEIAPRKTMNEKSGVWKTTRSWDSGTEALYSAWINALFQDTNEQSSWSSLHEVTQDKEHNFLYNYLSLGEDDPESKIKVTMQPDCADNPFFLRTYFSWKLGLPFGFHICDRGYLGKSPGTGQWITNESAGPSGNSVQAFNAFLRSIMNGVHSGTARTALDNDKSDYYPVALEREALRPGTVYADPYGHTLTIVSWKPQTKDKPGVLLAVDAQPDNTIAIKRFWKGNFLFNTAEVIGEPGFKAFRPIALENGKLSMMQNAALNDSAGFTPFSMQQRKMESEVFYHTMERLINPEPLDPESALNDLIKALHEQLLVRVKSVATGEEYMKSHPGTIIPMPSNANGIFLAGGDWENYSTPNRDLRLLIAIDAVMNFPEKVAKSPGDYKISESDNLEDIKNQLKELLKKKTSELTIGYVRSDGSKQVLTLAEIINRRAGFEMAYNPNDGPEIRWGAPENSNEIKTCKRYAPQNQRKVMEATRKWFNKRLHPPT